MGIDCWFDLTKRARVADGRVLPDWFAIDYHTIVDDGTAIGSIDIPAGWIDDRDVIGHIDCQVATCNVARHLIGQVTACESQVTDRCDVATVVGVRGIN